MAESPKHHVFQISTKLQYKSTSFAPALLQCHVLSPMAAVLHTGHVNAKRVKCEPKPKVFPEIFYWLEAMSETNPAALP